MPRSKYGGAYGVLASARALAGSAGPIMGGMIGRYWDIRWVFVWVGMVTLIASAWAAFAVRPVEEGSEQRRGGFGGDAAAGEGDVGGVGVDADPEAVELGGGDAG